MAANKQGGEGRDTRPADRSEAALRRERTPPDQLVTVDHKDELQRVRSRGNTRWSAHSEALFLDHLAASCNVSWSAAQAGFSAPTVYNHRRVDPGFAARWQAALEQGYARLETELVGVAGDYLEKLKLDPDLPLKAVSVRDVVTILGMHRTAVKDGASGRRSHARPRTLDDVRESILAKLEAIETAREREGAGKDESVSPPDQA